MTNDPRDEAGLEHLFEAARQEAPSLDEGFAARLMPRETAPPGAPRAPRRGMRWHDLLPTFGGLGMATAIGVWIGIAVPLDTLLDLDLLDTSEALDLSAFYAGADPGWFLSDEAGL